MSEELKIADLYNNLDDYYTSEKVDENDKVGIALTINKVEVNDDRFIKNGQDWLTKFIKLTESKI